MEVEFLDTEKLEKTYGVPEGKCIACMFPLYDYDNLLETLDLLKLIKSKLDDFCVKYYVESKFHVTEDFELVLMDNAPEDETRELYKDSMIHGPQYIAETINTKDYAYCCKQTMLLIIDLLDIDKVKVLINDMIGEC